MYLAMALSIVIAKYFNYKSGFRTLHKSNLFLLCKFMPKVIAEENAIFSYALKYDRIIYPA